MATVTAGNSATFEIGPFDTITLNDANALGTLVLTSQTPKLVSDKTLGVQNGTFGPWGAPMSVTLTVQQGAVDYTVNIKSLNATNAAAAASLGSGDGSGASGGIAALLAFVVNAQANGSRYMAADYVAEGYVF